MKIIVLICCAEAIRYFEALGKDGMGNAACAVKSSAKRPWRLQEMTLSENLLFTICVGLKAHSLFMRRPATFFGWSILPRPSLARV